MNCKVMGIVNVTPDSFSDGGQFFKPEEAIRRTKNLISDGADIIDLGGESTRPGATPIGWEEEWARIEPVLEGFRVSGFQGFKVRVSVDTYHPETAERAIKAGANIINCVYADPIPEMLKLLVGNDVELVMPAKCFETFVSASRRDADGTASRLYLDPMIGFNTTREEDIDLLRSIPVLAKKGRVLVGASRKRIVKKLIGDPPSPRLRRAGNSVGKNIGGNVGIAVWAAMQGASVVRVHDVKETVQALRVVNALGEGER